jgi:capsular exopolysaccharide synthesis family protein
LFVPKEDVTELRWWFWVIRRRLWLIVACTLLAAVAAFAVASRMPPTYSATATLLVTVASRNTASDYNAIYASERLILTYSQMLTGRPVMEAVIEQLKLAETPDVLAKEVTVAPVKDTQLIRLSVAQKDPARAALIANSVAETFIAQLNELIEAGLQGDVRVAVIETAQVPKKPIERRTLYTALAALVSAIFTVGLAILAESMDDTIKTPDDVRRALGLNTLGTIGRLQKKGEELCTLAQPHSVVAETFRMLCTNVRFSSANEPPRILLVTSPSPEEGKSIIAANLAVAMARAGLRVAAVDADAHRARLHQLFNLDLMEGGAGASNRRGPTGFLLAGDGGSKLHSVLAEALYVLPSGELPGNPTEMMGSQRLDKLLHELAQQVDLVLVDSPPVLAVADAITLAPTVDGVLLVLKAGSTRREAAQRSVESLQQVGANVVGVVLNGMSTHNGSYLHFCYEYYGNAGKRQEHRPGWRKRFLTAAQRRLGRKQTTNQPEVPDRKDSNVVRRAGQRTTSP